MSSQNIVTVDSSNFNSDVLEAGVPVLVDFWATWCGPCRQMEPVLGEVAGEVDGRVRIAKLNVDDSQDIAIQYGVQGIPTLILFKDGQVVDRMMGAMPKVAILELIDRNLKAVEAEVR